MTTCNVSEAKAKFSALVEEVRQGGEVILCKRNVPVVKLVSVEPESAKQGHRTRLGWAKGTVVVHGDLTEPVLPETDWEMYR